MGKADWTFKPLLELCEINLGSTPSRSNRDYWGEGHAWVSISDLKGKYISNTTEEITDLAVAKTSVRLVKKGTLLMSFKLSIGKLAFAGIDLYTNEAIVALPIKDRAELFVDYLYYALKFIPLVGGNQATMGRTLNKHSLSSLKIPLPRNLSDQKRIAKVLSRCEELIEKRKDSLDLLNEFLKSSFYEIFGNDNPSSRNYEKKSIEEIALNIVDCPHSTPKYLDSKSDYPCIRTSEIKNGNIDWTSMKYTDRDGYINRVERLIPMPGDIVFAREGSVGDAAIIPKNTTLSLGQRVMMFRIDERYAVPEYIWAFIRSSEVQHFIRSKTIGATVKRINISDVKKMQCWIPPKEMQIRFAEIVSNVDRLRSQYQESLIKLEELYKSISQLAFKGKLELSEVDILDMENIDEEIQELEPMGEPHWIGDVQVQDYEVRLDEIIKNEFSSVSFSFKQLADAVADKGVCVSYESLKLFLFKSLEGKDALLEQSFEETSEKSKEIVFKIKS